MTAFPWRVLVLLAAALLAGCAGSSSDESLSAVAAAPPPETPPAAAAAPAPAVPRPQYQGRGMITPAAPSPQAVAQVPAPTVEQARGECWMQYDRDKKVARDLDKRLKLVEACVEKKMSAPPPQ